MTLLGVGVAVERVVVGVTDVGAGTWLSDPQPPSATATARARTRRTPAR
jgi:hypothetical protein